MDRSHEERLRQIRAAAVDGRAESIRYRQNQLRCLHSTLQGQYDALTQCVQKDGQLSATEAETELYLAVAAVANAYDSLSLSSDLEQEYSIANGKDNASRRVGAGLVIIRPTTHTRVFSILSPLATAISTGNCVVIEVIASTMCGVTS
jgi:acyl-CoA reductase-like NAD-dependent aldehyde dehydrogenase